MGRKQEFKDKRIVTAYLEAEELAALDQIRWREHKGVSDIIRLAVGEYIRAHAEGNETFKLDNWAEDPEFKAIPTILADPTKWFQYLKECNTEERAKILKAANVIRTNAIALSNYGRITK
ncbi:MAG TPA: ribbon-helix-helix domain-containing protein [Nitrososphaeraceae archaeon]|nr:ribbon-helix-helix domain-containing protein [Nitrososphaeraceae archaeon]